MHPIVKQAKDAFDAWCAGTANSPVIEVRATGEGIEALQSTKVAPQVLHALQDPGTWPALATRAVVYKEASLRGMRAHALLLVHASNELAAVWGDDPGWMEVANEYASNADTLTEWYTALSNNPGN